MNSVSISRRMTPKSWYSSSWWIFPPPPPGIPAFRPARCTTLLTAAGSPSPGPSSRLGEPITTQISVISWDCSCGGLENPPRWVWRTYTAGGRVGAGPSIHPLSSLHCTRLPFLRIPVQLWGDLILNFCWVVTHLEHKGPEYLLSWPVEKYP